MKVQLTTNYALSNTKGSAFIKFDMIKIINTT